MSGNVEKTEPVSNMDRLKEQAEACGDGCSCHAGATPGRSRWVLGAIVLLVTAGLVVRAVLKSTGAPAQPCGTATFAPAPRASSSTVPSSAATPGQSAAPMPGGVVCGEPIQSIDDLNCKAAESDGVFVFLAGKDAEKARPVAAVVDKAAGTIRAQGVKIGLFTLRDGSAEYAEMAAQVSPPGVIAFAKGGGATILTGEVTESKLLQAYLSAASSGGCGPGSDCGPAGCK
jgi:MYXO-CTERM domain-containing protein